MSIILNSKRKKSLVIKDYIFQNIEKIESTINNSTKIELCTGEKNRLRLFQV